MITRTIKNPAAGARRVFYGLYKSIGWLFLITDIRQQTI